jgi:hypothetical protein
LFASLSFSHILYSIIFAETLHQEQQQEATKNNIKTLQEGSSDDETSSNNKSSDGETSDDETSDDDKDPSQPPLPPTATMSTTTKKKQPPANKGTKVEPFSEFAGFHYDLEKEIPMIPVSTFHIYEAFDFTRVFGVVVPPGSFDGTGYVATLPNRRKNVATLPNRKKCGNFTE